MASTKLRERDYCYVDTVKGMCRQCRRLVPARVFYKNNRVYQQSLCCDCGDGKPALICSDIDYYKKMSAQGKVSESPLPNSKFPSSHCPDSCGPCSRHNSRCRLPVFSITNACNMQCNHCFTYNRDDKLYFMSKDELNQTLDTMLLHAGGSVDLINITGGEPTLHPDILELLAMCRERSAIGRVTMNSNGVKLASDFDFCRKLAELGVYVVLSVNSFDAEQLKYFHKNPSQVAEIKKKAISNLTKAGVKMTLLNVMVRGVNEGFSGDLLQLMQENDKILSLNFQTMTYTGQGGGLIESREHIPADEAVKIIVANSEGVLRREDFVSDPSAHFLCYQNCHFIKSGDGLLPLARFATEEEIHRLTRHGYLLRGENDPGFFRELINRVYSEGLVKEQRILRNFVAELYPNKAITDFERQRKAEKIMRSIYVHCHVDEDTFDTARVCSCPDQVPCSDGKMVSACAYNLFYRQRDERFYLENSDV